MQDNLSVADLAYAAGLVDGEGSIGITTRKRNGVGAGKYYYMLRIQLPNTYLPIGDWLKTRFGGFTYLLRPKNTKWKLQIVWVVRSFQAEKFLRLIAPFLIMKAREVEIALAFSQEIHKGKGTYHGRSSPEHFDKLASLKSLLEKPQTKI